MTLKLKCALCKQLFNWEPPYEVQVLLEVLIETSGFQHTVYVMEDMVPKFCEHCARGYVEPRGLPC